MDEYPINSPLYTICDPDKRETFRVECELRIEGDKGLQTDIVPDDLAEWWRTLTLSDRQQWLYQIVAEHFVGRQPGFWPRETIELGRVRVTIEPLPDEEERDGMDG